MESLSDCMQLKCFVWTCNGSRGLRSFGIVLDLLQASACTENFDISFSSEIKIKLVVFFFYHILLRHCVHTEESK